MAQIPPIDDAYIDYIIKSAEAYNPSLDKTQGVKLRELIKKLRDRFEQENSHINELLTGFETILNEKASLSGSNSFTIGQKISIAAPATSYTAGLTLENITNKSNSLSLNLFNRSIEGEINGIRIVATRNGLGEPDGLVCQETLDGSSYSHFLKAKMNEIAIHNNEGKKGTLLFPEEYPNVILAELFLKFVPLLNMP